MNTKSFCFNSRVTGDEWRHWTICKLICYVGLMASSVLVQLIVVCLVDIVYLRLRWTDVVGNRHQRCWISILIISVGSYYSISRKHGPLFWPLCDLLRWIELLSSASYDHKSFIHWKARRVHHKKVHTSAHFFWNSLAFKWVYTKL